MSKHLTYSLKIWPFVLGILIVLGVNRLEQVLFPVVTGFTITEMTQENNVIVLNGYMRKDRNCVFAGVSAQGNYGQGGFVDIPLLFRNSKTDSTGNRPTGTQGWGRGLYRYHYNLLLKK